MQGRHEDRPSCDQSKEFPCGARLDSALAHAHYSAMQHLLVSHSTYWVPGVINIPCTGTHTPPPSPPPQPAPHPGLALRAVRFHSLQVFMVPIWTQKKQNNNDTIVEQHTARTCVVCRANELKQLLVSCVV